jgi:hypothetical protein
MLAPTSPDTPAALAHGIRDRVTALSNALELIRLSAAGDTAVAAGLVLAGRQLAALARLADALHDPIADRIAGETNGG